MSKKFDQLKKIVSKDLDHKDTVSFNYPKYEKMGTPHSIWLENVSQVENVLNKIIDTQPFPEEYPVMHVKNEEKDSNGRVIRVHFDIYGKTTMVKTVLASIGPSEQMYVGINTLCSDKGDELLSQLPAEVAEEAKRAVEEIKNRQMLKKVKVKTKSKPQEEYSDNGPLNLDGLESSDNSDDSLDYKGYIVHNPNIDDVN